MSGVLPVVADTLDVRLVPCAGKHELIFRRWRDVPVGQALVLINDHRPEPLRRQFERELGGCFRWEEIATPVEGFAVRLTRLQADPARFDPGRLAGCGLLTGAGAAGGTWNLDGGRDSDFDDSVLLVLQRDFRGMGPEEARERVLRLATRLPRATELWVDLPSPDPELDGRLTALGRSLRGEALVKSGTGWRYRIRWPDDQRDG